MRDEQKHLEEAAVESLMDWILAQGAIPAMRDDRYRNLLVAHRSFLFAADLVDAALQRRITPAMLVGNGEIDKPNAIRSRDTVMMRLESDQAGIVQLCRELFLSAWQRGIICADEMLSTLNRDVPSLAQETNHMEIFHIVRAIRDAFAHTAMQPRWDIRNADKRRIYRSTMDDGHVMVLDAATLHGQLMDAAHHEGWAGIDRLLVYTIRRAKEHVGTTAAPARSAGGGDAEAGV